MDALAPLLAWTVAAVAWLILAHYGWGPARVFNAIKTGLLDFATPRPRLDEQVERLESELRPWEEWRP